MIGFPGMTDRKRSTDQVGYILIARVLPFALSLIVACIPGIVAFWKLSSEVAVVSSRMEANTDRINRLERILDHQTGLSK